MATNNTALKDLAALTKLYAGSRGKLSNPTPVQTDQKSNYPWGPYPIGHIPYDVIGAIQIPVVGSGDVIVPFSPSLVVPPGADGVIVSYSLNFQGGGFDQGSGDIVWKILRNNQPIRNFDFITTERGSLQSPRTINNVRIYSTDILSITVNHVSNPGLNGQITAALTGYFYPQAR